jgi:hypothetical protein
MNRSRPTDDPARLLRAVLAVNAVATGAAGALALVTAPFVSAPLGLPGPLPLALYGVGCLAFAGYAWYARRPTLLRRHGTVVFELDLAYVALSAVLLLGFPRVLSPLGWWITLALAETVATFAVGEYVGLRRLSSRTPEPAAV